MVRVFSVRMKKIYLYIRTGENGKVLVVLNTEFLTKNSTGGIRGNEVKKF